jgi:hypothetical protein
MHWTVRFGLSAMLLLGTLSCTPPVGHYAAPSDDLRVLGSWTGNKYGFTAIEQNCDACAANEFCVDVFGAKTCAKNCSESELIAASVQYATYYESPVWGYGLPDTSNCKGGCCLPVGQADGSAADSMRLAHVQVVNCHVFGGDNGDSCQAVKDSKGRGLCQLARYPGTAQDPCNDSSCIECRDANDPLCDLFLEPAQCTGKCTWNPTYGECQAKIQ